MNQITAYILKNAAEGKYGPGVKAFYWKVDGHKTQIGMFVTALGGILWVLNDTGVCSLVGANCQGALGYWPQVIAAGGVAGIHIGQVGGGLKLEPPKK